MLRPAAKHLWFGLFVLLLVFYGYMIAASARSPTTEIANQPNHEKTYKPSGDEQKSNGVWGWLFRDPVGPATILLCLITGGLVWVGIKQILTTRQELRAYVFLEEAIIQNVAVGQIPNVIVQIKNFGKTPAYGYVLWTQMGIDTFPLNRPAPRPETRLTPLATLGPEGTVHSETLFMHPLREEEVNALIAGTHAIYFIGRINYRDTFGRDHFSEYCLVARGRQGIAGRMASYREGNNSD